MCWFTCFAGVVMNFAMSVDRLGIISTIHADLNKNRKTLI